MNSCTRSITVSMSKSSASGSAAPGRGKLEFDQLIHQFAMCVSLKMKSDEGSPWQAAARASTGRSSLSPILMCLGRWEGSSQVPKLLSSDSGLPGAGFIARRHFHHYTILVAAYAVLYSDPILGPAPGYPTLLIRPEKLLIAHRLYTTSSEYSFR